MFAASREVARPLPCPLTVAPQTSAFLSSLFPKPHPYRVWLSMLILEMKKPGLEQGETGPGRPARGQWSQGPGRTPSSGLNSFFSQEGTAHLAPSLGRGWGRVSGLGCVGRRAQKAQCLPWPLQPGPALFRELGGCPAPGWAKRATCDIHAHLGPGPSAGPTCPTAPCADSPWV